MLTSTIMAMDRHVVTMTEVAGVRVPQLSSHEAPLSEPLSAQGASPSQGPGIYSTHRTPGHK